MTTETVSSSARGILLSGLVGALLFAHPAQAIIVTDRWLDDLNFITGVVQNNAVPSLTIFEDYNEDNLIPYPSPNGYAVVDNDPGEQVRYFDKIFEIEPGDPGGIWNFDFVVTNTSPFVWSDYHFEVWDPTFTMQIGDVFVDQTPVKPSDDIFPVDQIMLDPDMVWFFDPDHCQDLADCQEPGEANEYRVAVNLDTAPISFGIRQIATVPEPATFFLLGSGFVGLGFMARRLKNAA